MIIDLASLGFYIVAGITLGGALVVVTSKNIVYAAFGLLISMLGVAGIFLFAFAEFLALVQVLIYGGAVVIVVLFALMLTRIEDFKDISNHREWPIALIVAISLFVVIATVMLKGREVSVNLASVDLSTLGTNLFVRWAVPFEVASLILLVALIGAIVIVRITDGRK